MNVAIFTDAYLPQFNGIISHILETAKRLNRRKHKILIVAPKLLGSSREYKIDRINVEYISGMPVFFYPDWYTTTPYSLHILEIIKNFKTDLIHFHTPWTVGSNGILISRQLKLPLVGTFHGYFMEPEYLRIAKLDRFGLDKSKTLNDIGWNYARWIYQKADVIISPSEFTKQDLINHGFNRPITVISNGIALNSKPKSIRTTKQNLKFPKKYFLYVGRISVEKSLDILIESFALFSKKNHEIDLVLVGGGPAKKQLEKLSKSLNLINRVHFLGIIPHSRLLNSTIYKNALCFVTTSKSEVLPISILEAFSYSLPIIGVKARGVIELVDDNGILCPPDNIDEFSQALYRFSMDKKLKQRFRINSLKMAQKHSIEYTIDKLESLYSSLIEKN